MTALKIKIDGKDVEVDSGGSPTIFEAARLAGIPIPTLCHHPALEAYGSCRLCTVQIEKNGRKRFVTACNYPAEDGLVVETCSAGVAAIRKMILELLLARCPQEKRVQELAREYSLVKPRFLMEDEDCILCGLCYRVCGEMVGVSAINAQNRGVERDVDTPYGELSEDCIGCGACALVCPTSSALKRENIYPLLPSEIKEIEDRFLDGSFDGDLAVCREIFAGRSGIEGQDGGMVTSILLRGIERGLLDAAVVVRRDERRGAVAVLAEDADSILQARGTKYVRISVVAPLIEALQKGRRGVAVVGTPCQIRVVRRLQMQGYFARRFPDSEIYLIGLFCFESFDYALLKGRIEELFGADLDAAEKMQIARGKFLVLAEGREHSCKIGELAEAVREGCDFCDDLVSRLADISIGSIGSPEGLSTVIVRSEKGKRLLEGVAYERREVRRDDVVRLAAIKRKNAEKNFEGIVAGLHEVSEEKRMEESSDLCQHSGIFS
jgi:coenzyme F420-reducing hydrogenase beta subunit